MQTDWWTRIPALRLAEAHANNAGAAFMYEFAWPSPVFNAAVHALEIPFVFDTLDPDLPLLGPLLGPEPPQQLADRMHAAWAFAASGDPGWPKYDLDRRATMRFGVTSHVVDDPWAWERRLWDGVR